jgi:hypothetical protein
MLTLLTEAEGKRLFTGRAELISSNQVLTAPRDFDYEFHTLHAKLSASDLSDTMSTIPIWPRRIEKRADILRIVNEENTADCITYRLHYIGLDFNHGTDMALVYTTYDTQDVIYINPVYGQLSINKRNTYY